MRETTKEKCKKQGWFLVWVFFVIVSGKQKINKYKLWGKNNGLNKQKQELIEKENMGVYKYMCGRERRTRRGKNCFKEGIQTF